MTEQRRLAEALSGKEGATDAMHWRLRRWGFQGSTLGFDRCLRYLIGLADSFRLVASTYPNLQAAVDQLLDAASLRGRLQAVLDDRERTLVPLDATPEQRLAIVHAAFDTRAPSDLSSTASDDMSSRNGPARFPADGATVNAGKSAAMLLEAAALVLHFIWNGYADRLSPPLNYAPRVIDTFLFGRCFGSLWKTVGADIDPESPFSFLDRIQEFVLRTPELERLDADEFPNNLPLEDWAAFDALLRRTRLDDTLRPSLTGVDQSSDDGPAASVVRKTDRRWGNRCSTELCDRELLPEGLHGLSDDICRTMAFRMRTAGRTLCTTQCAERVTHSAMPFVLNVAIHTGRTPTKAFAMRVRAHRDRSALEGGTDAARGDEIITVPSATGRWKRETWWRTARFPETCLMLQIEASPPSWPEECVDFELGELFALPPKELEQRVIAEICELLDRSPGEAALVVRHTLAREMHSFNANRAAIEFVCGQPADGGGTRVARGSLSRYVHPLSACVANAYRFAQMRLANGREGDGHLAGLAWPSDEDAGMWIPAASMRKITDRRHKELTANGATDLLLLHNHYALWTLALIEASIGGRVNAHPLHFAFDIDEHDGVLFVADKIAAGSEARFVPLVELAKVQFKEYVHHVRWLVAKLHAQRPRLAAEIEAAMGWRASGRPRELGAAGMFFIVRNEEPVAISSAMIDAVFYEQAGAPTAPQEIALDTRARRRNIATFLANTGASGMAVEAHLGHAGDQHPFGSSSCWIPLQQAERLRPLISRYLETNGWTFVPAHWIPEGRQSSPLAQMPSFEQTHEAYDGRAMSADAARDRARIAVREVLDAEQLDREETVEIDEAVIARMRAALERLVANDPAAHAASTNALDALVEQWKVDERYEIASRFLAARQDRSDASSQSAYADGSQKSIAVRDTIRDAIRAVLPESVLKNLRSTTVVDEETIQKIRSRIGDSLAGDLEARRKVLGAFGEWMSRRRRRAGFTVTAASVNLARFAPGPVATSFGRHLAIARFIRARAFDVLRDVLDHAKRRGTPEDRRLTWLAAIAVLLTMCDGVLNEIEMPALIDALQAGDIGRHGGQLQLRATISTAQAIYDRTVDLTDVTASAVLGLRRLDPAGEPAQFTAVRRRADDLVRRMAAPSSGMTLSRLMLVMRPYWFLRWPGSTYASAIGAMECNAASELSIQLLLGGKAAPLPTPPKVGRPAKGA